MFLKRSTTMFIAGGAALLLAALAVAGCGSTAASGPPKTSSGMAATLGVSNTNLGKVLVDSQGRTLYLFTKDSGTTSACAGACAVNWPPLVTTGKETVGQGAKASIVSTSARTGGRPQLTYNGHPLYRFKGDGKPGEVNGEGLTAFGGSWFAVSPAGGLINTPAPNSGGSGNGY